MGIKAARLCALLVAAALPAAVLSQNRRIVDVRNCVDCTQSCNAFVSIADINIDEFNEARESFYQSNLACRNEELEDDEVRECTSALDVWKTGCLNRQEGTGSNSPDSRGLVCENRINITNGDVNAVFVDYPCILSVCMEPINFDALAQLATAEFADCQEPGAVCTGTMNCNDNENFRFADPAGSTTTGAAPQAHAVAFSLAIAPAVALLLAQLH